MPVADLTMRSSSRPSPLEANRRCSINAYTLVASLMGREAFDRCYQVGFGLGVLLQRGPLHVKPLAEHLRLSRGFRTPESS